MRTIFLVGMPGAGKSYWGQLWAKEFRYKVWDLDAKVEASAGLSIPDIFLGVGESGFRTIEAAVMLDTISMSANQRAIIVTGGGTPIYNNNMDIMLRAGCVVYLRASTQRLFSNIVSGDKTRPLLRNCSQSILDQMLQERKAFYERAHVTFDVETICTDTFAEILKTCSSLRSSAAAS